MKEEISKKLDTLLVAVGANSADIKTLKADISELKTDVSELKSDVSGLKVESSRTIVLLEDTQSQMALMREMMTMMATKADLEDAVRELSDEKIRTSVMREVLAQTNRDVADHETRITSLEVKAA